MAELNGWVIFLSIVASFIAILLTLIGVLLKYGIDTIRGDIQSIWEWIKVSDRDKLHALEEMTTLKAEVNAIKGAMAAVSSDMKAIITRCSNIHMSGGKRWSDPKVRPLQADEINHDEAEAGFERGRDGGF